MVDEGYTVDETAKSISDYIDMEVVKSELCLRCMKCCMSIGFPFYKPDAEVIKFYEARGAKVYRETKDIYLIVIKNKCPHLDLLRGCDIYQTRPSICKEFDGRQTNALKGECLWETLG